MLVSSTEPFIFKALGTSSMTPERYGCDFLIVKGKAKTGVQRKKFPNDLIASLADGRLYEQVHLMGKLDRAIILFEGYGKWTSDGELMDFAQFTKHQMYSLIMSLAFEFGIEVLIVRDMNETQQFLVSLESWSGKEKHSSLRTRPGPSKDSWGRVGIKEYGMHLLQSFPGVGPELAGRIWDHFGGVPIVWEIDGPERLAEIQGIGKQKAAQIYAALVKEKPAAAEQYPTGSIPTDSTPISLVPPLPDPI